MSNVLYLQSSASTRTAGASHPNAQNASGIYWGKYRISFLLGIALCFIAILTLLTSLYLANTAHASTMQELQQVTEQVTVGYGDTLWSIAEEHSAGMDVRDVLLHIMHINDLSSTSLDVGQKLEVPLYSL
ncbi:LysM peptidoglycan-binding domain-containing protein [Rothia sp. CCM 9419]|uniref:LysM peptidoglycan-binding domain-containing protein n=1 Tax=Rothia sp. CCM 9419 TaxID=3402662 RepID=UPI003AE87AB8